MSEGILPSEHVAIVGATGSGKTYTARKYHANIPFVAAIDIKGTLKWPEVPKEELTIVTRLREIGMARTPKVIYRPNPAEMNEDYYDAFFEWCYKRKNTRVWVDEARAICPTPFHLPFWMMSILTRGRELNVGMTSITQRPKKIPLEIFSESTHFFVHHLNLKEDRERMVEVTERPEVLKSPVGHDFWYYRMGAPNATLARLVDRR